MKKVFLSVLIFGDMVMIAACTFLLYKRLSEPNGNASSQVPVVVTERPVSNTSTSPVPALAAFSGAASSTSAAPVVTGPLSNVLFSYFNKKATRVAILGDFTAWQPLFLQQDEKGFWKHAAKLAPGEYGYYYEVDAKPVRDPLNKKTKKHQNVTVSVHIVKAAGSAVPATKPGATGSPTAKPR